MLLIIEVRQPETSCFLEKGRLTEQWEIDRTMKCQRLLILYGCWGRIKLKWEIDKKFRSRIFKIRRSLILKIKETGVILGSFDQVFCWLKKNNSPWGLLF
jgi:hypothetical protein